MDLKMPCCCVVPAVVVVKGFGLWIKVRCRSTRGCGLCEADKTLQSQPGAFYDDDDTNYLDE